MRLHHWASNLLLLTLLGSCQIGRIEPLSIAGEAPVVIAIWPMAIGGDPPDSELWFSGLSSSLTRRGYRVLPPGITAELLRGSDIAFSAASMEEVGRAVRADAVMRVEVGRFDAEGSYGLQHAEWDFEWRLLSTRGYGEQWSYSHHGAYQQADRLSYDPGRRLDEQHQLPDIVPIGGDRRPNYRNAVDLVVDLSNLAMMHLPMHE